MEWILIGIAIAIGFYVAPFVITFVIGAVMTVISIIGYILKVIFGDDNYK